MILFKVLGLAALVYTGWSVVTGAVWAKQGVRARLVVRDESPVYFWTVIVIYAGMSVAMMTVF